MRRILYILLLFAVPFAIEAKKKELRPYVWVLDAGHGGHDGGTHAGNVVEKDINLRIVKELEALLRKNKPGITLKLTRDNDTFVSLERRCQIANNANADLFISIHTNFAIGRSYLQGTETFFASSRDANTVQRSHIMQTNGKSEMLARLIQRNYATAGRMTNRGAKPANYYVIMNTHMPAVLTEVGFISNQTEMEYLSTQEGVRQIATGIYNALAEYHVALQKGSESKTLQKLRSSGDRESGLKTALLAIPAGPNLASTTQPPYRHEAQVTKGVQNKEKGQPVMALVPDAQPEVEGLIADNPNDVTETEVVAQAEAEVDPFAYTVSPSTVIADEVMASYADSVLLVQEDVNNGKTEPKPVEVRPIDQHAPIKPVAQVTATTTPAKETPSAPTKPATVTKPASQTKTAAPVKPNTTAQQATSQKATSQQQTAQQAAAQQPTMQQPSAQPARPIYRIQLFSVRNEIKQGDVRLKGLSPVDVQYMDGVFKVFYSSSTDYRQTSKLLVDIRNRFPDAFIVAFLNGVRITTAEALKL